MRISIVVGCQVLLGVASAPTFAQDAPPVPTPLRPAGTASPWACTRATLLDDAPCIIDGRSLVQSPALDQARENQRYARALSDGMCALTARAGGFEPDPILLQSCRSRADAATRLCTGDGSVRMIDDEGRFNNGFAPCYAALSSILLETGALAVAAVPCCECLAGSCGTNASQCTERLSKGRFPEASQTCLDAACSTACAQVRLSRPGPPQGAGGSAPTNPGAKP